jgi:hypothetical protein
MNNFTSFFMKRGLGLAITALPLILAVTTVFAQEHSPITERSHPAWSLDLSSAGLAAEASLYKSPRLIRFVNSDTLLVSWFVSHRPQSPGAAPPATLKAVYIDAKTGKELSKSEWEATDRPLGVSITSDGNLLVQTGQTLRLFSPELKQIRAKEYSASVNLGLGVSVSPNGATALLRASLKEGSEAQVLRTDTLQVLEKLPALRDGAATRFILGDKIILTQTGKGENTEIVGRTLDETWHPVLLSSPASEVKPTGKEHYTFLSENVVAVQTGYCVQSFSVLTIEGKNLLARTLPKGRCWGSITTTRSGQYFGILEERIRGLTNEVLDMYAYPSPNQFVVYRMTDLKEVFRLKVEGVSPWPSLLSRRGLVQDYAVSPDGGIVVVMTNGVVRSYVVR